MENGINSEFDAAKLRIQELESIVASLSLENEKLKFQNANLMDRIRRFEKADRSRVGLSMQEDMMAGLARANNREAYSKPEKLEITDSTRNNQITKDSRSGKQSLLDTCRSSRHIALKIMYLGTRFHGFAAEASKGITVESELFAALEKTKLMMVGRGDANYSRCGRTDKGVSATGQVVALDLRSCQRDIQNTPSTNFVGVPTQESHFNQISDPDCDSSQVDVGRRPDSPETRQLKYWKEIDYVGLLNRGLPPDIRVVGWSPVPQEFSARFNCLSRQYTYFFFEKGLNLEAMRMGCSKFVGNHDFRNFCKMDAANIQNYQRTIYHFNMLPCNGMWSGNCVWMFQVKGSSFLWHQVRCMVAVLFMIGQGNESPSVIDELLDVEKTKRKPQYIIAPPLPLVLHSCEFEGVSFQCSPGAVKLLRKDLEQTLNEQFVIASIFRDSIDQIVCPGVTMQLPGEKSVHIPLKLRPTEPTYEERRLKLMRKSQDGKERCARGGLVEC